MSYDPLFRFLRPHAKQTNTKAMAIDITTSVNHSIIRFTSTLPSSVVECWPCSSSYAAPHSTMYRGTR